MLIRLFLPLPPHLACEKREIGSCPGTTWWTTILSEIIGGDQAGDDFTLLEKA